MKKISVLVAIGLIASAFVLPSSPAKANPFGGAAQCEITLPVFPTTGRTGVDDNCDGVAVGIDLGGPTPCVACTFSADVAGYNETCVPPLPPPLGFADGTITSPVTSRFQWVRAGLTAVLLVPQTAGVAAFAPLPPIGTCGAPGPLTAEVVGVAFGPVL